MHLDVHTADGFTATQSAKPMVAQTEPLAWLLGFWRDHPGTVIFVVSLAVRIVFILVYGAGTPPVMWGDDNAYDAIAMRLVTKHELAYSVYPIGYSLFLALIYGVFGQQWFVVRLLQGALGGATCVLTYRLGTKVFDGRVGRLAGLLLAFYPGHVYMSWRIMAETLFIFLLVWALNIAVRLARQPVLRGAVALGLLIGAAQLVKSNLYVFPALLVAWSVLALGGSIRQRLALSCCLAGSFLVVSLVTPLGNLLSTGGAAVLPGSAGRTLWVSNNPLADGYQISPTNMRPAIKAFIEAHGLTARLARAPESEKDRLFLELGLAWIRENPGRFLILCLKKLDNAFGLFPRAVTFEGSRTTEAVHLMSYGVLAPLALAGIIAALRRHRVVCAPLFLTLLGYIFMVLLFYGTPRFTIVVMPVLIVFASSALWTCADHSSLSHPPLACAGH